MPPPMRLLVLIGAETGTLDAYSQALLHALQPLDVPVVQATGLADALQQLATAGDEGPEPVVVLGPQLQRPARTARQIAQAQPQLWFVFVPHPADEAALARELAYAAPPGHRWSLAALGSPTLQDELRRALETQRQRGRFRTTLTRLKARQSEAVRLEADEYQRLVASDHYLATVLQQMGDAVVALDLAGRVVSWNHAAEALFGLSATQAQRRSLQQLVPEAFDWLPAALEAAVQAGTVPQQHALDLRDHPLGRMLQVTLSPLGAAPGVVASVVLILRDTTEQQRAQDELAAASRRKDEFLAMLAHELRNPLAPVRSAAAILRRRADQPQQVLQLAELIDRQAAHMTRLVDDLLDVSRITRGLIRLQPQSVELGEVVADAVQQARPAIEGRGQQLQLQPAPEPLRLHADPVRLVQVLGNLLNNASKFTPEQGRILLAWGAVEGGQAEVRVVDSGIGMAPAFVPQAFDLFTQAEASADRVNAGLGIGLALVKALVELHGGSVGASSAGPGQGSCFWVRLPRADNQRYQA